MRTLVILALTIFSLNLWAGSLAGEFRGQQLFDLIKTQDHRLTDPSCIGYVVRRGYEDHKLHMAIGNYIDSITITDGYYEIPADSGDYARVANVTFNYKNQMGNAVTNGFSFRCRYK